MYLKELVNYNDITKDGIVTDSEKYTDWLAQVNDGITVVLADIGVDGDYDEWLDENEEDIILRLSDNDIINKDMSFEEECDFEETLHDLFEELNEE